MTHTYEKDFDKIDALERNLTILVRTALENGDFSKEIEQSVALLAALNPETDEWDWEDLHDFYSGEFHELKAEHERELANREADETDSRAQSMGGDYWQNDAGEWRCG